ncbi:glycosyl transferase [Thermaurantimonas aggregans]|uniref:Glycosyl transferase n=1 Tax=Thermaurantimonas aggregans TaxID=2173829 RepID=A0A401XJ11_9FLAO|nr:glycosyltransferase family 2 protein [Thermaurantimonas aggregans]MCX8149014.1 glycosyltransferase [Thermaurantimonas aggregans]GCD76971.1 glycosyl transferase [Thermaurantimonas aggregans]
MKYVELLLFVLIGIQVFYFFIFAVAGLAPHELILKKGQPLTRFAVLIPGYKEDKIIVDTARQALEVDYPRERYRVIVLADSFQPETVQKLRAIGAEVLEVIFDHSTKAKSINKGLEYLENDPPEAIVILDSDNVMAHFFLRKVSDAFKSGHQIIQAHRTAKNKNTPMAILDAANEEIGNHIFRKGHRNMGLSSALIGSGMVFEYHLYKKYMAQITDTAGEDKQLEMLLLKDGHTIEFYEHAYVYDEKVSTTKNFGKQRTRWLGAQFYFFRNYFLDGLKHLILKGNVDYFDKCFQMALIPKVLLIGLMGIVGVVDYFTDWLTYNWLLLTVLYYSAMLISVPASMYNKDLLRAIAHIPVAIVALIGSILRINKKTATHFEVTEKGQTGEAK